ncbi:hypothetical protein [Salinifilum ghardaiensis]
MTTGNDIGPPVALKPLRIVGIVVGGVIMAYSLGGWFAYLGATFQGWKPVRADQGIVTALFSLWLLPWMVGLIIVLASTIGWLRRTRQILIGLTLAMAIMSGISAFVGAQ